MTYNAQDKTQILNNVVHIPEGHYITKRQAATLLSMDVTTVQYHIKKGALPTILIGNVHLIRLNDVKKFNPLPQGRPKKYNEEK